MRTSTVGPNAEGKLMLRRFLLACGVLASLFYVGTDVVAAIGYPEYHSFNSRAISELMASGAPTERLVDPLFLLYGVLMMAFGVGVWMSGHEKRVHVTAGLLFAYAAIGVLGPTVFEMNVRGSGGDPAADVFHIALTMVLVLFIFASVGFGAAMRGRSFRLYSFATLLIMVVFGVLTGLEAPSIDSAEPSQWFGALERINIGAFLLWVVVLAMILWRVEPPSDLGVRKPPGHGVPPFALPTR
jgi:hypothetical protein